MNLLMKPRLRVKIGVEMSVLNRERSIHYICLVAVPLFSFFLTYSGISAAAEPVFKDPNLRAELVAGGLSSPTSMAFIDDNNILVLEKNSGQVRLVSNGILQQDPILELDVDTTTLTCCRGLLGMAITEKEDQSHEVFIYLSEADDPVRNKLYKYQWDNNSMSLVNPKLLLDLPATPGPNHPGGKITIGLDDYLYTVIGDLSNEGKLQNIKDGPDPSDSSVILKINTTNGTAAYDNPFLSIGSIITNESQRNKYYAYGIRNSFGIAIDPITGFLWDTENGDKDYDEINLVRPGFNSGWKILMGPMSENDDVTEDDLVMFEGSYYADPVLSWKPSLGLTDIEFLNSSRYGDQYRNNMFIGDITNGNLYFIKVNNSRTGLVFENAEMQADSVADGEDELDYITLGTGFGGITDIETGPDGLLYILTFDQNSDGAGAIYRIRIVDPQG
jgi:aldose sugar dehydrogenase